jgi:hypothetical protein
MDNNQIEFVRFVDEAMLSAFLQARGSIHSEADTAMGTKWYLNTHLEKYHYHFEEFFSTDYILFETLYTDGIYQVICFSGVESEVRYSILRIPHTQDDEEEVLCNQVSIGQVVNYFIEKSVLNVSNIPRKRCLTTDKLRIEETLNTPILAYTMPGQQYDVFIFRHHNQYCKLRYDYILTSWSLTKNSGINERVFNLFNAALEYLQSNFDN